MVRGIVFTENQRFQVAATSGRHAETVAADESSRHHFLAIGYAAQGDLADGPSIGRLGLADEGWHDGGMPLLSEFNGLFSDVVGLRYIDVRRDVARG